MPILDWLGVFNSGFVIKAFAVLFVTFYCFFAAILYRQVQIMTRALPGGMAPFLKFIVIVQIGTSLALLFSVIGVF